MMNEGLICLTTNLETNSNFTRSNSGVERRDGIWVNSATGVRVRGGWWGSHPGWMLLKSAAQAMSELHHQHRSHHCLRCFCWLAWCGAGGVCIKQSAPTSLKPALPSRILHHADQYASSSGRKVIQRGPHLRPPCQSHYWEDTGNHTDGALLAQSHCNIRFACQGQLCRLAQPKE